MSNKTYILILFIMIVGLSLISYLRLEELRQTLPEVKLPKIEMPKPEEIKLEGEDYLLPAKEEKQEWISADGKLKLTYSGNWLVMDEAFSESLDQPKVILVETKILFFAYQFKIKEQALAFLMVGEIDPKKSLEEIIKEAEQNAEEQGGEIEITILDTKNRVVQLEIISTAPGQPSFYSRGKLIFSDEKTYLVILTTSQKDWSQFKEEAEKILESSS